jgi:hypothetical protein
MFRILSAAPAIIEAQVNEASEDYQVLNWAFAVANNEVIVTAVLIHKSEIRKLQLAMAGMGQRMQ